MNKSKGRVLREIVLLGLSSGIVGPFGATAKAAFSPQELRCEYLSNPSGIDVPKPRFSWTLNPAENVRGQSAYRVLVATSPATLNENAGDLWDSGRVVSHQSTWIEYAGKNLVSGQRAYWKVQVWSDAGKASLWSERATWSMGQLQASDFQIILCSDLGPD